MKPRRPYRPRVWSRNAHLQLPKIRQLKEAVRNGGKAENILTGNEQIEPQRVNLPRG